MLRIGVDIGGTFTDFVARRADRDGYASTITFKVPSTPPDFAEGFKTGLDLLLSRVAIDAGEEVFLTHGTTVSTNAVIERSGPRIALLTTRGFRDILELRRLRLADAINVFSGRPAPLIPRQLVFEIDERMSSAGAPERDINLDHVEAAARRALEAGAEGFAVAFLHSYRNPAHEIAARQRILAIAPETDVSLSSEIWPRIGEYERAMACVLNAFVRRRMDAYIGEIEDFLAKRLPRARLFITRSNGGAMGAAEARRFAVQTLLSGPASGVTAAQFIGARRKERHILTMDMGGTSTDLSLIRDGLPSVSNDAEVGDFPLMMPVTGIEAIGAAAGSIARIDGNTLRVGPHSAGARPGPACFDRGGVAPTVTDAYLLCGYLDPAGFLGGEMRLDPDKAAAAIAPLAKQLGVTAEAAADACISVATSNMVASVLPYLARHGVDPEEVTLVAFGGNGALHAPLLALEVGVPQVLVPTAPSVFCAFGGVVAELVHDTVSILQGAAAAIDRLRAEFAALERSARVWLLQQSAADRLAHVEIERWAEMRYAGQSFNLSVRLADADLAADDLGRIEEAFHAEHERLHAHADRSAPVSVIELRVRIRGAFPTPRAERERAASGPPRSSLIGRRSLRINGALHESAAVHDRAALRAGELINGPSIIQQPDATILVPPEFVARVEDAGEILLTRSA